MEGVSETHASTSNCDVPTVCRCWRHTSVEKSLPPLTFILVGGRGHTHMKSK